MHNHKHTKEEMIILIHPIQQEHFLIWYQEQCPLSLTIKKNNVLLRLARKFWYSVLLSCDAKLKQNIQCCDTLCEGETSMVTLHIKWDHQLKNPNMSIHQPLQTSTLVFHNRIKTIIISPKSFGEKQWTKTKRIKYYVSYATYIRSLLYLIL